MKYRVFQFNSFKNLQTYFTEDLTKYLEIGIIDNLNISILWIEIIYYFVRFFFILVKAIYAVTDLI